jgi:adenylosuccinate lyase
MRFNQVLLDFDRDIWSYIAIDYFRQRKVERGNRARRPCPTRSTPSTSRTPKATSGSPTPCSPTWPASCRSPRWQRDLSDSTVLRNIGSAFAYTLIACEATLKGIGKLELDEGRLATDLDANWEVLAEPIQTVMRRYAVDEPYEKLKALTRGQRLTPEQMQAFIETLEIPAQAKAALSAMSPASYLGNAAQQARRIREHLQD